MRARLILLLVALAGAPWAPDGAARAAQRAPAPEGDPALDRLLADSARAYEQSDSARGLALLTDAHALAVKTGQSRYEAEALRRLAIADVFAGDPDRAIEKLTQSRALFAHAGDQRSEARASLQLSASLRQRAPDASLALARHAWQVFEALDDAAGLVGAAGELVYALPEGAEKDHVRQVSLEADRRVPDRARACSVLHEWGDELFNQGRLGPAREMLTRTLACWPKTNDRVAEGRAFVSMGRLYRAHGRLSEALDWHTKALALQESVSTRADPLAAVQSMNAIATTLLQMGRASEALPWFEKALERAIAVGRPSIVHFLRAGIAAAHLSLGRNEDAATLFEAAIEGEPAPALGAVRRAQLSLALVRLGQLDKALEQVNRAVAESAPYGFDGILAARSHRAAVLVALRRFDDAEADLRVLVELLERMRADTVPSDVMKRGFHDASQQIFAGYIDLLGQQGKARESLEMAERARARAFLDLLATRAGDPARAEPASADELRRAAGRLGSTVVSYWVGADTLSIWVVPPRGEVTLTRVPVHAARLAELVQQASGIRAGTATGTRSGLLVTDRSLRVPWRELEKVLVAPIAAHLPSPRGARLTIIPHGVLFGLSFAGLRDARGRYLLEQYEVHYVPAGAVLAGAQAGTRRPALALVVGDPGALTVAPGEEPLPALPWARSEAETARRFLGSGAVVLTGDDVTESRVRESVRGRGVLHFATHGIIHNEERLSSYLALRSSPGTDGRLTADEVYGLSLDADLVVLSACRTALGPIGGDGVIGFTRAFLTAGARSVVATQWDVSDRASYEVMQEFYRRRAAGAGTSRALRGAQLAVLTALRKGAISEGGRPLPETPRLWAGFVLVGEP